MRVIRFLCFNSDVNLCVSFILKMSNKGFPFLNHKDDPRYQKIWMAAINSSEFQRLMRFENCEHISVPSICDEITLKLNEESNRLASTELSVHDIQPRSFLVASQLFIGLIYVYEQQVIFLYDLVSRCTFQKRSVIENPIVSKYSSEDDVDSPTSSKKVLKRKGSTKARTSLKRKFSLVINTSDECEDIETQNAATMELLQNAFVANKADITIRESFAEPVPNDMTEPTYPFELPFQEDIVPVPEQHDYDLISTPDQQQSIDETALPINVWESTGRRSAEMRLCDTNNAESRELENTEAEKELAVMDVNPDPVNDLIEMNILEEDNASHNGNATSRKRKRRPFQDLTMNVNVRENVKTASSTLRHPDAKGDSVSKSTCLSNLSRRIFDKPSHSLFSESMLRQFESRSMSPKLLQSFRRMTLTKPEGTNSDMVQEFCNNRPVDIQPTTSGLNIDNSITDVPLHCQSPELTLQMDEVPIEMLSSQPTSVSYDEQMTLPIVETSSDSQHMPVELSPVIRQILVSNETVHQFSRCDTDSQKLFASRSRQNKLDWGAEGVLQKLITLWNSGVCPIGMNEIMESNKQRIAAATAFFSIMELNSARVGLINIIKSPDSNIIYNIIKSPKLIELQQVV